MAWRPSTGGKWFLNNGSLLTAISSLFIAVLSLIYTVEAQRADRKYHEKTLASTAESQRVDREYREASVRPHLQAIVNPANFSIELINYGLGPAFIVEVKTRRKLSCIVWNATSTGESSEKLQEAFMAWARETTTDIMSELFVETRSLGNVPIITTPINPGLLISVGGSFSLYKLEPNIIAKMREQLNMVPVERAQSIMTKFARLGNQLPFSFEYCSLTGRSCSIHSPLQCDEKRP